MTSTISPLAPPPLRHPGRFLIGGEWVEPSSGDTLDVIDSVTEELFFAFGQNAFRTAFGMAFGGFKQSGISRKGGKEGPLPFLETKTVILDAKPKHYQ